MPFGPPLVDECRNEVDARLVGNDESLLQPPPHAQTVRAELFEVGARLVVEADVGLPQALHVVNVHTHHVAQAVRQEHGVRPGLQGVVGIALHQSQLLELLGHHAAYGKMHIHILHARLGHLEHVVVAGFDNRVDVALPLCEGAVDGHGARVV